MPYLIESLKTHSELTETKQVYCFILKEGPVSDIYGVPCLRVLQTRNGFSLKILFRSVYADTEWENLPEYLKQSDLYSVRGSKNLWGVDNLSDTEENFKPVIAEAVRLLKDVETLEVLAGLNPEQDGLFWHPV